MPSDLIYREDAKDYVRHAFAKGLNVLEYLDEVPAANFRPVVKARWIRWVRTDTSRLVCSNCGNPVAFVLKEEGWHHGDFCPNCGADMRED